VDDLANLEIVDLGDGDDVACVGHRIHLGVVAPLHLEQVARLEGPAIVAAHEGALAVQGPLQHPDGGQLAEVGIGRDLEDVPQEGGVGITGDLHQPRRAAHAARARVGRAGGLLDEDVEEIVHAHLGGGGGEQDGDDVAAIHRLHEAAAQAVEIERLAREVALERLVVHLHRRLQDLPVHLCRRAEIRLARVAVEAVDHVGAALRRQVDAVELGAEGGLELGHQGRQPGRVEIDLVDHDHPRQGQLTARREQAPGIELDSVRCVDHHHRRLHGREGGQRLSHEVG
jgi:hypothetical protein